MVGSSRNFVNLACLALAAGCVDHEPLPHETTSLRVTITAPSDLGSDAERLPDSKHTVSVAVQALDQKGAPDPSLTAPIDVYVQTLGRLSDTPMTMMLENGVGTATVEVPIAFGQTYLWFEDGAGDGQPTGASPPLWYREPFLDDLSTPPERTVPAALQHSQLEGKQVRVSGSRFGANGHLVVTGVYASGYTLSDVDCSTRPCVAPPYGHIFVYSFGRAVDARGRPVELGQTIRWVAGGSSEFNGYTELNFPDQEILDTQPDQSLIPDPVVIAKDWLDPKAKDRLINLEQVESALVAVEGAKVCPLDGDYTKYAQWKLDVGWGCSNPVNVITAGQVPGIDPPSARVGKTVTRVVGTLKTVNLGSFNAWIVQARRASDITD